MTYDSDKRVVRWYRLEYPIEEARKKILSAGLPDVLANRLQVGDVAGRQASLGCSTGAPASPAAGAGRWPARRPSG